MIAQGYPLWAVDEDGGLHLVVGWVQRPEPVGLRRLSPVLVDATGYLDPVGGMPWDAPVRYFASSVEAERHSNGDKRQP